MKQSPGNSDFYKIREKPLIRVNSGEYMILNISFFLDKLYQSIQFTFADALISNNISYKGKVIKDRPRFYGIFGDISEKYIFYRIIEDCFGSSSSIKFTGKELGDLIEGAPDYYIRNHNNIFIFEFKNSYINSKYKFSTDIKTIKDAILSKFCYNDGKTYVGIPQLVRVIDKIKKGEFDRFDKSNLKKLKIYPILVYVDSSLDTPGVNFFLNNEFKKRINIHNIENNIIVKNLVAININSFIEFQDLFKKRIVSLNKSIDNYFETERKIKDFYSKYFSYSDYLPHSQYGKKIDFANVVRKLIKKELDNN